MLRFIFGASGAGKSVSLYREVIERAEREPERNFFILVPDQFTMQTQMDVVREHPRHGIMNIDVLSFGRLSHRILAECGGEKMPVLDDTGKSLLLRHAADKHAEELPYIGRNMHKAGYIDEVKSTISEFMQYNLSPTDLDLLIKAGEKRSTLQAKLKDLRLLYATFLEEIKNRFRTPEETLGLVASLVPGSALLEDSVIAFDGFTGFTPVQYRLLGALMATCSEVICTVTIPAEEDLYSFRDGVPEQDLFYLSKKTIFQLEKTEWLAQREADLAHTPDLDRFLEAQRQLRKRRGIDRLLFGNPVVRLSNNPPLAFLEAGLFRYPFKSFSQEASTLHLSVSLTREEEISRVFRTIRTLIREDETLYYRDFAIVCGTQEDYEDAVTKCASLFHVPCYIDKTRKMKMNPYVEFLTAMLQVIVTDFAPDAVFHFLKSGILQEGEEDIFLLENYVRARRVRGREAYGQSFVRAFPTPGGKKREESDKLALLQRLNALRKKWMEMLSPLLAVTEKGKVVTAGELTEAVREVTTRCLAKEKLDAEASQLEEANDSERAAEFRQIYEKTEALLTQIQELLCHEKMDVREYAQILDAGFSQMEVGTIPRKVDRVLVGDIERTRLREVKYLFFTGVDDASIPGRVSGGGILSETDRNFLLEREDRIELAPTPRAQMYIQRLYLYLNLTKPSRGLYLSLSAVGSDGKSLRPAYLISVMQEMFPSLILEKTEGVGKLSDIQTREDALHRMAPLMRSYADGLMQEEEQADFLALYGMLQDSSQIRAEVEAAFKRYEHHPLAGALAEAIYTTHLENSVSRLERFAECHFAHFAKYALSLQEREEDEFDAADLGNVFHGILEDFANRLEQEGLSWKTFSKEEGERLLHLAFEEYTQTYGESILYGSARRQGKLTRIERIMQRTVEQLQYQLKKGDFMPEGVEVDFQQAGDLPEIHIDLSKEAEEKEEKQEKEEQSAIPVQGEIVLHGRIDRVDLAHQADKVYVKIIDFKSGKKDFDIAALYYGLQLQLVVYMEVAKAMQQEQHPDKEVIPAALLYYHVSDPLIKDGAGKSKEEILSKIRSELRTTGLVNESDQVIALLDEDLSGAGARSDVIPVKRTKNGTWDSTSSVVTQEEYDRLASYVKKQIRKAGRQILNGDIAVNPYQRGDRNACTYCPFRSLCGFDPSIPGYHMHQLEKWTKEEVMHKI